MKLNLAFIFTLYCFLVCSNNQLFAQDEAEIVISEERLQELAIKLYELKKSRLATQQTKIEQDQKQATKLNVGDANHSIESKDLSETDKTLNTQNRSLSQTLNQEVQISEINQFTQFIDSSINFQNNQNQKLLEELAALRSEIKDLKNQPPEVSIVDERNDDVVVRVNQRNLSSSPNTVMQKKQVDTLHQNEVIKRLESLQLAVQQRDSVLQTPSSNQQLEDEIVRIKNQVYLLQAKIDQLIATTTNDSLPKASQELAKEQDTLTKVLTVQEQIENERDFIYNQLAEKYSNYKELVYFENNSTQIANSYDKIVNEIAVLLAEEKQIDVLISGFASKRGAEDYNQMISMKRAHELKRQLMNKGVSPNRILTDYKGIDYDAQEMAEARRVEVELIIRR